MEEFQQVLERTSEVGLQELASNHLVGAAIKSRGTKRTRKRSRMTGLGMSKGDERE